MASGRLSPCNRRKQQPNNRVIKHVQEVMSRRESEGCQPNDKRDAIGDARLSIGRLAKSVGQQSAKAERHTSIQSIDLILKQPLIQRFVVHMVSGWRKLARVVNGRWSKVEWREQ